MQSIYDEIYSLLVKEYFRAQSQSFHSAVLSLSGSTVTFVEDELNAMSYTRKWLVQINRGGLFPLNNNCLLKLKDFIS